MFCITDARPYDESLGLYLLGVPMAFWPTRRCSSNVVISSQFHVWQCMFFYVRSFVGCSDVEKICIIRLRRRIAQILIRVCGGACELIRVMRCRFETMRLRGFF